MLRCGLRSLINSISYTRHSNFERHLRRIRNFCNIFEVSKMLTKGVLSQHFTVKHSIFSDLKNSVPQPGVLFGDCGTAGAFEKASGQGILQSVRALSTVSVNFYYGYTDLLYMKKIIKIKFFGKLF